MKIIKMKVVLLFLFIPPVGKTAFVTSEKGKHIAFHFTTPLSKIGMKYDPLTALGTWDELKFIPRAEFAIAILYLSSMQLGKK
jgi:hypothetical protein